MRADVCARRQMCEGWCAKVGVRTDIDGVVCVKACVEKFASSEGIEERSTMFSATAFGASNILARANPCHGYMVKNNDVSAKVSKLGAKEKQRLGNSDEAQAAVKETHKG
eukprot:6030056-Pleurochrysis_carterae.AAC.1